MECRYRININIERADRLHIYLFLRRLRLLIGRTQVFISRGMIYNVV